MNRTLATPVLGISPEMQLLELIDQAARRGTPEDAEQIYRKNATTTVIVVDQGQFMVVHFAGPLHRLDEVPRGNNLSVWRVVISCRNSSRSSNTSVTFLLKSIPQQ